MEENHCKPSLPKDPEARRKFFAEIGRKGGSVRHPETRAFSKNRELARKAGALGRKSKKRRKEERKRHE